MTEAFDADEYTKGGWKTAVEKQCTHYQRLGLNALEHITTTDVRVAHRLRATWWRQRGAQAQGGKNNPLIAELVPHFKTAEENLKQAFDVLSNVDLKLAYDRQIEAAGARATEEKLQEFIRFTLRDKVLTPSEKNDLLDQAHELGILRERAEELIQDEMKKTGAREENNPSAGGTTRRDPTTPVVTGADRPRLVLSQTALSLGTLRRGQECVSPFTIDNLGGGVLQGAIDVSHPEWMKVSQPEIDPRRHHQEVTIRIDTSNLALGTTYVGMVEVRSNGGRQGVRIDFSVELEKSALLRYRTQLFWMGLLAGGVFGLLLYTLIPDAPTGNAITRVAGNLGLIAFVVVCARAKGWGGGIGGFLFAGVSQEILQHASMRAYSAGAWAAIVSAFLYFCARRLLVANLSRDRRTRAWVALSGVGLVAIVIVSGLGISSKLRLGPIGLTNGAPEQIVDRGACPFEGCRYGERWIARQNVDVYTAPPNEVGVSVSSLRKKASVHAGTWVRTETGVVLARRREGRVTVVNGRTPYGGTVKGGPPLKNGQVIPIYSYLGEGCWRSWIGGQFLVVCDVTVQGQAQNEWWIQITTAGGTEAWTNSAGKAFVSEEGLNSELGERILDTKLALPDKLAQIDALLRGGAGLNGSSGKYGNDPLEAAIRTKDVDLLRALVSKGLNIRKSQPCPAYWAAQNALSPGGDQMLEFLLGNGMQLSCLTEPPLHAFLYFGIATDSYAPDRAIRIAEILVKHGARIDQRDSQGKSIFDLLDQPKWASRVAALRDTLANLAKQQAGETVLDVSREQTADIDHAKPSPNSISDYPMSDSGFRVGAYRIGGGVSSPRIIFKVEPDYSEEARTAKLQGTVLLSVVVDDQGRPQDLKVMRSVGLGLDEKAIEAVKKWRFKPGMKDGRAVPVAAIIEVNFRLL